jgi:hypothetical protein
MPILWAGGEDIDFPNGGTISVGGNAGLFRSAFARHALGATTAAWSIPFPGGAVTSCWFSFRCGVSPQDTARPSLFAGLVDTTKLNGSGLWVGSQFAAPSSILALHKFDGTTITQLATATGAILDGTIHKYDIQVINYGATATVNVYIDGSLHFTFTGNIAVGSVTALNGVGIVATSNYQNGVSELIVADEDTRAIVGLVTMPPSAAGTTDAWAGVFTDVNETTKNDTTAVSTNTVGLNEQFALADVPAGNFAIKAVVVTARATGTAGATATKVALGFNSGGTVAVGAAQLTTTAWVPITQIFANNPVTSAPWALSEMNPLQVNLQSGS